MGQKAMSAKAVVTPDPLGTRLRDRRQALGLTLKEVGDQAGLSVGFISQIERGITIPSLTSLINVCRVLKSEVGDFLKQPRGDKPVTRHDQRPVYALGANAITTSVCRPPFPATCCAASSSMSRRASAASRCRMRARRYSSSSKAR